MHISRIDLNLFVVLDCIYTHGGITRAADQLNLSQSAVSHALTRLRELLGDPLFERHGHTMVPTPFTRSIIARVRDALRTFELTLHETNQFDVESTVKRFTLGVRDVLEPVVLPPVMKQIVDAAPSIDVATVHHERRTIEADLLAGTMDAVIDVALPIPQTVRSERLASDELVVLSRRGHPRIRKTLSLDAYVAEQHVLVTSRRRGLGMEDMELVRAGLQRHVRLRCMHYSAACRVVSQTDLLLTMPGRHARLINESFGNAVHAFPLDSAAADAYLYWHANADGDPANQWFRQRLIEAFH
ncbi:LysR family transcriptional regulator [Pararobbsia silviterrae]|uniref:LysR family transcriptional regulator n=1 Tax=Pararobbsia silviterrae TaxID=1792498 RepID=A0A494Y1R9_9BURK|nr:LysR family transcriptional regulator [Pararobbsia silviterrae]RKP55938.1 LysR family transcriptional regulator [Pararobbsia silviterrae]